MRSVLGLSVLLAAATLIPAAEDGAPKGYDFTITSEAGQVLGTGKIRLPFQFGSDGEGFSEWKFTPNKTVSTNKYWLKAKARLANESGKAKAKCKDSWFTLNFNAATKDNNVVVSWPLKEREAGDLEYADFSGGHTCGLFNISRNTQTNAPPRADPQR